MVRAGRTPPSPSDLNPRDPLALFEDKDKSDYGLTDRRPAVADKLASLCAIEKELLKPVFRPQARVLLRGLVARADLNGKLGEVVTELKDTGRIRVKLLSEPDAEDGEEKKEETLAVKPQNLEVIKTNDGRVQGGDAAEISSFPEWARFCYSVTMNSVTDDVKKTATDGPTPAVPPSGAGSGKGLSSSEKRHFPKDVRLRAPVEYLLDDAGGSTERDFSKQWWQQPFPKQRKVFVLPLEHHGQAHEIIEASKASGGDSDEVPEYTYKPKVVENYEERVAKFDNYEWLADCYRLRLSDEVYWCVGNTYNAENGEMKITDASGRKRKFYSNRRGLYAQARSALELKKLILLDLALFLGLAAKKKLLPQDFDTEKFLQIARRENKLVTPFSKTNAIDKYGGENVFSSCRSLRRTGEEIYGTSLADLSGSYLYNDRVREFREGLHLERPPPDKWVESKLELELALDEMGGGANASSTAAETEVEPTGDAAGAAGAPAEAVDEGVARTRPPQPVWFVSLLENFFTKHDLNPMKGNNVKQLWETNFLKHPEFLIPSELVERCGTLCENTTTEAYLIKIFPWEEERMPALPAYRLIRSFYHFLRSPKMFRFVLEFHMDDCCVFSPTKILGSTAECVAELHKNTMGQGEEELLAFAKDVTTKYGGEKLREEGSGREPESGPPASGSSGSGSFSPASRKKT
eukprot:g8747.t1